MFCQQRNLVRSTVAVFLPLRYRNLKFRAAVVRSLLFCVGLQRSILFLFAKRSISNVDPFHAIHHRVTRTRLPLRRFLVCRSLRALFHFISLLYRATVLRTTQALLGKQKYSGTIEIVPPQELRHIILPTNPITAVQVRCIQTRGMNSTVGSLELLRWKSLDLVLRFIEGLLRKKHGATGNDHFMLRG